MVALTFFFLSAFANEPPAFTLKPTTEALFILVFDSSVTNDAKGPDFHFAPSNFFSKNTDPAQEEDSQEHEDK
jgi:hypothetical protein